MKLIFEKKFDYISSPDYAHPGEDSGMDIFCPETIEIAPGSRVFVDSGIRFNIPRPWWMKLLGLNVEIQVRGKSSRNRQGLITAFGTVDNQYTGTIGIVLYNTTKEPILIARHDKLCQLVVMPVFTKVKLINKPVITSSTRGNGGFGSTGGVTL